MKQIVALICLLLTSLTVHAVKRTEAQAYNDVRARVIEIISEKTGIPSSEITEDKNFVRDLKMDQIALEAVRDSLSLELGTPIADQSAEKITTVQRAINYVFIRQQ
jgi:acyl carrier protein